MASECQSVAGFELAQRVQTTVNLGKGLQIGTVKYIGYVDGYEGLWIGVDWDSGQGRHNGTVNGKHYFQTSGKESGSLVRPHTLSTGITLLEALTRRYNASESHNKGSAEDDMYVLSVRQRRMPVELVGKNKIEKRQKELQQLQIASLANSGVSTAGTPGQVNAVAPNIKELDLTGNLLPDWLAVGKLCEELPSLQVLNLSCSRLRIIPDKTWVMLNVKTLVLNNCEITWGQVEQLKNCLVSVEELHLCGNNIKTFEDSPGKPVKGFESLRLLNLEDNCIESWEEILKLSKLSRLEHLNLNLNRIHEVVYPGASLSSYSSPENDDKPDAEDKELFTKVDFGSLRCLLLGKNQIADWASIDALDRFPALRELRLSENPITNSATGGAPRYMLIARIQKVTGLNGSEIKQRERRDAEIRFFFEQVIADPQPRDHWRTDVDAIGCNRYVRHVLSNVAGWSNEELDKLHPRMKELRLIHDVPVESAQRGVALTSQKMSATLLSINIQCISSSVGEKPPVTKRFPASTTVGKLKQICEALFKLKAGKQRLYVKDQDPLPVPLENNLETLVELGLGEGAVILVDEA